MLWISELTLSVGLLLALGVILYDLHRLRAHVSAPFDRPFRLALVAVASVGLSLLVSLWSWWRGPHWADLLAHGLTVGLVVGLAVMLHRLPRHSRQDPSRALLNAVNQQLMADLIDREEAELELRRRVQELERKIKNIRDEETHETPVEAA